MLIGNDDALAYYGLLKPFFSSEYSGANFEKVATDTALAIQEILKKHWKVHFWDDSDAQKHAINDIDDYLYDELKGKRGVELSLEQMDEIIERTMQVAKHRVL